MLTVLKKVNVLLLVKMTKPSVREAEISQIEVISEMIGDNLVKYKFIGVMVCEYWILTRIGVCSRFI